MAGGAGHGRTGGGPDDLDGECMGGMQGMTGLDSGEAGESPFAFNPERGTGQGDISSPHTWEAVFDILLRALETLLVRGQGKHPVLQQPKHL